MKLNIGRKTSKQPHTIRGALSGMVKKARAQRGVQQGCRWRAGLSHRL